MTKKSVTLGLLPLVLSSLAFGQDAQHSSTTTAPKAAPLARLGGGVEVLHLKDAKDMALPYDRYPGIQFRSSKQLFAQYPDRSKTPNGLGGHQRRPVQLVLQLVTEATPR